MKRMLTLLALALPAPVLAQAAPAATDNPAVATARMQWEQMTGYVTRAAEQLPEADYGFRPVESVRTFGQLVGHVANAQYMFCSQVLGEESPSRENIEEARTTKAALLEALRASTEYCKRAYALTDAQAFAPLQFFGQPRTRFFALSLNVAHNAEHYGNLATYLRAKGLVPPSSQPRQ